jgi:lipopolysaccharide biosynthesis glycosyltransferase
MKIERIYIAGHKNDLHFTRCCVASIRHWYPRIPISLIKDESNGAYSTEEIEKYWHVDCFKTNRRLLGFGFGKLEPLFLPTKERCLILDSDIVFLGKVLNVLEQYDEDFIVADTPNPLEETSKHYFNLSRLHALDPAFIFPNYTFNSGQMVATMGILGREDFEPFIRFDEPPTHIYPDIFVIGEQGVLNYVLMRKFQEGKISLRREYFMWWAGSLDENRVKIEELKKHSPYPVLIHWAGYKRHIPFDIIRNAHLLRYFESVYYSRIPNAQLEKTARPSRHIAKLMADLRQKWPPS